jgi:outer membrane protein assembly factor BamB
VAPTPQPAVVAVASEIVEPVSEIYRFPGRFIHATKDKVFYLDRESNREGWWTLVSQCLASSTKEQIRVSIPAGDVQWCVDHFIVAGVREVVAVSLEGKVEWRFTLPGKPDSRESLLGIVGNDLGKVFIASQFNENPEKRGQSYCRVFAFGTESGRLIDCVTFAVNIPNSERPLIDLETKEFFSVKADEVICFDLATGREKWNRKNLNSDVPGKNGNTNDNRVSLSSIYHGSVIHHDKRFTWLLNQSTQRPLISTGSTPAPSQSFIAAASATAPFATYEGIIYAPVHHADGSGSSLSTLPLSLQHPAWKTAIPEEITVKPVVTKGSVYVVAGHTLYRIDRGTGTVCWKKRYPIKEQITEIQLNGTELWLSGQGFLVRVQNEKDSAEVEPKAIPPAE